MWNKHIHPKLVFLAALLSGIYHRGAFGQLFTFIPHTQRVCLLFNITLGRFETAATLTADWDLCVITAPLNNF